MLIPRSSVPHIYWPAIPDKAGCLLLSILYQLEATQWWPTENIRKYQFKQLGNLVQHAQKTVPFYHQQFRKSGVVLEDKLDENCWACIPLLSRSEFKKNISLLTSKSYPDHHGKVAWVKTSGTTGASLQFLKSEIVEMFWRAITIREQLWHGRDYQQKLMKFRSSHNAANPEEFQGHESWDKGAENIYKTGPSIMVNNLMPIEKKIEILASQQPQYILLYPSTALALALHCKKFNVNLPGIAEMITYGEPLHPAVREICQEIFNAKISDIYYSEEAGYIALQCPENVQYHVQSESLLVEVLNNQNQQCKSGETGKVVITTLYNFAMPLIRFETGDYAEVGEPCPCGRGLPVIKQIFGRKRNAVTRPDNSNCWPDIAKIIIKCAIPIEQLQILQKDQTNIEIVYSAPQVLGQSEQKIFIKQLQASLGYEFQFSFTRIDEIPTHANGKFEYVVNETFAELVDN